MYTHKKEKAYIVSIDFYVKPAALFVFHFDQLISSFFLVRLVPCWAIPDVIDFLYHVSQI